MSKEFKKGDKVSHPMWGNGVVIEIDEYLIYPVRVEFKDGQTRPFTTDGKYFRSDNAPSLYHGHGTYEIKFTPEPEPVFEWQWLKVSTGGKSWYETTAYYKNEEVAKDSVEMSGYWKVLNRIEESKREVKP